MIKSDLSLNPSLSPSFQPTNAPIPITLSSAIGRLRRLFVAKRSA